ncbi:MULTISPECIES: LysR family transcriptional regulator [unclassified Bacillus (in: firmicutes)]|uniref:LysR family transcriptional regulator n=1 Tax=unclassified Bacillus (in: firmicutes) TaxID=185979 RepID=UPI000BF23DC6|nr:MULTISPECIES: LysR family transcriptional regulator [unclassified Bacillus (in: firmicutes)]PEJ50781.1 hypothetical protein CN692_22915 [Bacillus sp. AFS002410]PEL07367.1 hypothetical protein CN601_19980 [Bacillus sp. AFS017336]
MNIKQLSYLSEFTKSGSYKIAAQKFLVSEAIIKKSLFSLENELGIKLVECHDDSKVVPSFEALEIFPLVNDILINYQEFEEVVKFLSNSSFVKSNMMYEVGIL